MLRGLAFLSTYAHREACWTACASDVAYMFFHLATRSRQGDFTRTARALAKQTARRWMSQHSRLPRDATAADVLWRYAYGAYTAMRMGEDTRALRSDLSRAAARLPVREVFGFHPKRETPPSAEAWQDALVGSHIAHGVGMRLGWTIDDAASWRLSMHPYPKPRRKMGWRLWSVFYAVTHLVYVLNDYNLYVLSAERFAPEVQFLRQVCRVAIDDDDVEGMGEAVDTLLALGAAPDDALLLRARSRLLALQNRNGSWGDRYDDPYTRMHKTWVALDGLTPYGRRATVHPRLHEPMARRAQMRTEAGRRDQRVTTAAPQV